MRILHVTAHDLSNENGYRTRVFSELRELRRRGVSADLLALLQVRYVVGRRSRLRQAFEELSAIGVSSLVIPTPPDFGRHRLLLAVRRYRAMALGIAARRLRPDVLHAESTHAGDAAILSRRLHRRPVVLDLLGASGDERAAEEGSASPRARVATLMEKSAVQGADAVIALGPTMVHIMTERWRRRPGQDWLIMPSCVDTELFRWDASARAAMREHLGLGDRPVVVYAGGWQGYQQGPLTIRAFRELRVRIPGAVLLLVVPRNYHGAVRSDLDGLEAEDFRLLSVPHSQVAPLLSAADVGIALNDDSVAKHVASPTKVAEYLACGVPVVASATTGDLAALLPRHGVGEVTPSYDAGTVAAVLAAILERVLADRLDWAERCAAAARAELDWSAYTDPVLALYGRLAAPAGDGAAS